MAVERVTLLTCEVDSQPGVLQGVLQDLADKGLDLHAACGYETSGGKGRIYALPKSDTRPEGIATVDAVHLTGADTLGAGAQALKPLADAGVNLKTVVAVAVGDEMHLLAVVDDIDKAMGALKK